MLLFFVFKKQGSSADPHKYFEIRIMQAGSAFMEGLGKRKKETSYSADRPGMIRAEETTCRFCGVRKIFSMFPHFRNQELMDCPDYSKQLQWP